MPNFIKIDLASWAQEFKCRLHRPLLFLAQVGVIAGMRVDMGIYRVDKIQVK